MNKYIFITNEGNTYQPNSDCIEPDCSNAQVIGIASGNDENEAFINLKKEFEYLKNTSFSEIYCYQLITDRIIKTFTLN